MFLFHHFLQLLLLWKPSVSASKPATFNTRSIRSCCAEQVLSKRALCTVVMFSANLGVVPLSCHPLCQPEAGEESHAAFKCTGRKCVQESECQAKLVRICKTACRSCLCSLQPASYPGYCPEFIWREHVLMRFHSSLLLVFVSPKWAQKLWIWVERKWRHKGKHSEKNLFM